MSKSRLSTRHGNRCKTPEDAKLTLSKAKSESMFTKSHFSPKHAKKVVKKTSIKTMFSFSNEGVVTEKIKKIKPMKIDEKPEIGINLQTENSQSPRKTSSIKHNILKRLMSPNEKIKKRLRNYNIKKSRYYDSLR